MVIKDITVCRKQFFSETQRIYDLVRTINSANPPFKKNHYYLILELSFLKIYSAWEEFLEVTFINYLMGTAKSKSKKITSFVIPKNYDHAQEIINEGRRYVSWTPEEVGNRAERFLKDGKPYKKALNLIKTELQEILVIRNRIAHNSIYSYEKFKYLVRSKLGYFSYKKSPGEFLFEMNTDTNQTFFEFYVEHLVNASKKVAP